MEDFSSILCKRLFYVFLYSFTIQYTVYTQSDNLVGVVNVGEYAVFDDIDLFTVSVNENIGELPVTLAIYNVSSNTLESINNILEEDVTIFCAVITPFTEGDTTIQFRTAILTTVKPSDVIQFHIGDQGRAVEVQCMGYSSQQNSLFQNSTKGNTGFVAVKKSPVVSFCEEMIVVPYLLHEDYTEEVILQLSEEVVRSEVNVSCKVDPMYQGEEFVLLRFFDQIVPVGTKQVTMKYIVLAKNLQPVLVSCSAQSLSGVQYLSNVSGSNAMFGLTTASVQFVPFISNIVSSHFKSFLILETPVEEGQVAFSCYVTAVNDSLEAKYTAENPVCERPEQVARPTAIIPPSTDSSCVNMTCTTQNVTSPSTTTTQVASTEAPIDSNWYLDESIVMFNSGDVFKEVVVIHENIGDAYRGLLVLTCCASADINQNPQYTNLSAALLMVVDVAQDREITSFSDNSNITDETVFPNPAYVEIGPCKCDLTAGHCDTLCCCDLDCTDDDLVLFPCLPGIPGGNFTEEWEYSCSNTDIFHPDWFPFMCVQTVNKLFLGYFFPSNIPGARNNQEFQNLEENLPVNYTTFREDEDRALNPSNEFSERQGYVHGAPIQLLYKDDIIGSLALPEHGAGGNCLWTSAVKYQIDSTSTCQMSLSQETCSASALNARLFLQSSGRDYPPCPVPPRVVNTFGYATGMLSISMVEYYCLDDLSEYIPSTETKSVYGLYAKSLPYVVEKTEPSYSRCVWDDDFTQPPEPSYNTTTQTCDNAVVEVQYDIIWSGGNSTGEVLFVKGNVFIGSVPTDVQLTTTYSAKFMYEPLATINDETGGIESREEEFKRSGNPGYQIGEVLLSGVSIYEEVNISTPAPGCNDSIADGTGCNLSDGDMEFSFVDTSFDSRLKYISSGPTGLCEDASYEDITFGEDLSSGCIYRIGLSELDNCTLLQQGLERQLKTLVQADRIAKVGNASSFNAEDWITVFREPIEYEVMSTIMPYQERVNDVLATWVGTCYHMPVGVHLHILYADAGMVNGLFQQEVVAAKISYRTESIQLNCAGAHSASCQQNASVIGNERVQQYVLSNWVTFTKVPAVKPEPVIYYFRNVDESLCKQDKCPEEAFYPLTRAFQGDSFEYSLAVWLTLILFGLGYLVVIKPWL